MRRLSADEPFSAVTFGNLSKASTCGNVSNDYQPGKYIACVYDKDWFIGHIDERSDENNDVVCKTHDQIFTNWFFFLGCKWSS